MEIILFPVANHDRWTRTVANVVTNIENQRETRAIVVYRFTDDDLESSVTNLETSEVENIDELAARRSGVKEVVTQLEQNGIDCRVRGVKTTDTDGEAILSIAADVDADRIYIYSRKRSPTGKAIFGSDLQHVLFNATVPVVVIPSNIS